MTTPLGKQFLRLIAAFFFLLTDSTSLQAQTIDGATTARAIRERVIDAAGAALIGAPVTPGNPATGLERVVMTDANGDFVSFAPSWGARSASECVSPGRKNAGERERSIRSHSILKTFIRKRAAWKPSRLAPRPGTTKLVQ